MVTNITRIVQRGETCARRFAHPSLAKSRQVGYPGIEGEDLLVQLYRLHFGYVKSALQGHFTAP